MDSLDLEYLLKQVLENPSRYIIIDREREFTIARFAKQFGLDLSTVNSWVSRNKVRVRRFPELNNLRLMQMDFQTLSRLKQFDVLAKIQREDSLTEFYKMLKLVNTMEWVEKVCELIDSENDLEERYKLIESLQQKIRESKIKSSKPGGVRESGEK